MRADGHRSRNYPDTLDEALMRPGRFDVHVHFKEADGEQAKMLFEHFYAPEEILGPSFAEWTPVGRDVKPDDGGDEKARDVIPPALDLPAIQTLADRFATSIFARTLELSDGSKVTFSMAALQGYLLLHKREPQTAAERVGDWVQSNKDEREKKIFELAKKLAKRKADEEYNMRKKIREETEAKIRAKAQVKLEIISEASQSLAAQVALPPSPVSPVRA